MKRLWMVRHGPTHAKGMIGWTDLPADLSDTAALKRLNTYLPKSAAIVSSDLKRAVQTADALAADRIRLAPLKALREMYFGDWEGKTHEEASAINPELVRQFWEKPGRVAPPNGEAWNRVKDRVNQAIDTLMAEVPSKDIVIVSHFGTILTQLQRATAMPHLSAFVFTLDNLSVTRLEYLDPGWKVQGVNHCP